MEPKKLIEQKKSKKSILKILLEAFAENHSNGYWTYHSKRKL